MQTLGDVHEVREHTDQELVSALAAVCYDESRLAAHRLSYLAEIDRRGLAMKLGFSTATRWFARSTRITDGSAARQSALGYWLTDHPTVLDALATGEIHSAHAMAVADGHATVLHADAALDVHQQNEIVAELLDTARNNTAGQVITRAQALAHAVSERAAARYARERLRREEAEAADREVAAEAADCDTGDAAGQSNPIEHDVAAPSGSADVSLGPPPTPIAENPLLNRFDIHPLANGRNQLSGNLDRVTAEKLMSVLSGLTAPRPGPNGERDRRTPSKRRADALDIILDGSLSSGQRNRGGPARASVQVVVPLRDLLATPPTPHASADPPKASPGLDPSTASWPFDLEWTGPMSRSLAGLLTCDADLTPVIVDDHGVPLAMGRTVRLATDAQRAAVVIRDRCCIMCGRPARWCHVHHVRFWINGGRTDLGNLALLCGECHRLIHNSEWQLAMGVDGHPYAIPPAHLDPDRQPIPSYHRRRKPAA